jgi:hypothetical protein
MAKRVSTAKKAEKSEKKAHDLNPDVTSSGCWTVFRPSPLQALSVNADQLDVTENGTLIFFVGGSNAPPQVVIAGDQYLYCTKVR